MQPSLGATASRHLRFSRRTNWPVTVNELFRACDARRRSGAPLYDLTVSNPTTVGLPLPDLTCLADPQTARYQPEAFGLLSAREAVADYYQHRGIYVAPHRILLTASTSEAYGYLFSLLADEGDEVLVPSPSYPLFSYLADLAGVRLVTYPLRYDGSWYIDLSALETAVSSRSRAVIVVSPNNPTGSYLKHTEHVALRKVCLTYGLALIGDEVFADYPVDGAANVAKSFASETAGLAFALSGLSKVAGLPQLKLGWMVTAGATALVEEAQQRLGVIADTYLSVGAAVQYAAPTLLDQCGTLQSAMGERARANLRALRRELAAPSPATVLPVEAGWSAVVRLPATQTGEQWALALLQHGVLVHPGHFYEVPWDASVVVSLLPEGPIFAKGAEIMRKVCAALA